MEFFFLIISLVITCSRGGTMAKGTDRQEFIVARIPEMRQEIRLGERKKFLPPTHADGRPVNRRLSTWASLAELTDRSVPFLSFIANNLLCWNSEGGGALPVRPFATCLLFLFLTMV